MKTGYREVKQALLNRLRAGEWPPGAIMPGEVQLAKEFACARVTVNRAIRELADEGIVRRRRRRGTEVLGDRGRQARLTLHQARQQVVGRGQVYAYRCLSQRRLVAGAGLAQRLEIPAGSALRALRCLHLADEQPFQLETRWICVKAVPEAAEQDFAAEPPGEWLMRLKPLSEAEHRIQAAAARPPEAARLQMATGAPLFVLQRRTWWRGDPVTWARLLHPGDAYELVVRDGV
ncbi:MAG: UTRA domain-containing protein [Abyssibacter sp.]|uniref:UTRA domain-containing protein n=1 Tax=Abyssibacter sp. TaxID=2320200 RepID=UPI00321B80C3